MKIFWSWQSDTPGKTGRHFVRNVLAAAIKQLKQPDEIEEPTKQENRETLHLDHDRKGVSGSPDLAPTIFKKIKDAAVFVADVTLVGRSDQPAGGKPATDKPAKRFINSNVAIEYGYALGVIGDGAILMIQNLHYGERDALPFDLKHKAGPIQYLLAPDADTRTIEAEATRLKAELVTALRPYIARAVTNSEPFQEIETKGSRAVFFDSAEVLARVGVKNVDEIEYRFNEPRAFYLRLIPNQLPNPRLKHTALYEIVRKRELDMLCRERYGGISDRNRFGAIAYEPDGTSSVPRTFSQTFTNGELWSVTTALFVEYRGDVLIPTTNVENIFGRVLANFCSIAQENHGLAPPYQVEMGAIGLQGACLGIDLQDMSSQIHENTLVVRLALSDVGPAARKKLVDEFLDSLFDLAGRDRN